jgi:chorismate mutase/prephenate dehydratase
MAVQVAVDPLITQLRRQITETDRAIVELVNERLELVATMKDYKARRGIEFVDPEREHRMLTHLQRANGGPLTAAGLSELFGELLALTKREVARLERVEQ